jgi:putative ATP-dependent endonuclease of the OLD family
VRLTRIKVINHSRLIDLEIQVRQHMVLVGPNDVGKSSVLRCLDLLLGASTAQLYQRIVADDFRDREQPVIIEADLADFTATDEALFPDEISVDEATGKTSLTLRLSATVDAVGTLNILRIAPRGGTDRQISREQLEGIGWRLLGATGLSRDLREDRRSALDDILQAIDLGAEQADFDALARQFQEKLRSSSVLDGLRDHLAGQLSKALPQQIEKEDLVFIPGATADNDVLSDVRLQVTKDGASRSLVEQSDGTRALYAIALYDLTTVGANMVGIDEPEIHLHPTSQRSLAKLLQDGVNQKFIATHSSDIVGAFPPECIAAVRAGGIVVQAEEGFLTDDERMSVRWWVRDKLEPLTARHVIAVEGISDRIILERASDVTNRNLDRLGISVVETSGAGDMGAIIKLFGNSGFHIPMALLIDKDATKETANKLGVPEADLEQHSTWVSDPDLEAEYTVALGAQTVWAALSASPLFSSNELASCAASGVAGARTDADVAAFCRRNNKTKVRAAMVVAQLLDDVSARAIKSVNSLLDEVAGP